MKLDVGCGEHPRGDVNVDLFTEESPHFRHQRKTHVTVKNFVKADVHHLPFKDKAFTETTCTHVIEHLTEPVNSIQELIRVTNGEITVVCPHRFGWGAKGLGHLWSFNKKWFMKALRRFDIAYTIRPLSYRYSKPFPFLFLPNELVVKIQT